VQTAAMHSQLTGRIAEFLSAIARWGADQPDVSGMAWQAPTPGVLPLVPRILIWLS
jgi:hypothetical protein